MASQSLQFSWYTALFLSSFGMWSFDFLRVLTFDFLRVLTFDFLRVLTSEGCLGVECCVDVVLIKCSFKLLAESLDVRYVDAFGLLRFFFWALSWLF